MPSSLGPECVRFQFQVHVKRLKKANSKETDSGFLLLGFFAYLCTFSPRVEILSPSEICEPSTVKCHGN